MGEQLSYGVASEAAWTDNVYGDTEDEVDDGSGRLLPWGQLQDYEGDLTWSLRYAPSYGYYLSESELTGFDHDAQGSLSWRMGPRTSLSLSDAFRSSHSVARFNEEAEPGGDVLLQGRRDELISNQFSAVLQHNLSPLDFVSLSAAYGLHDFSPEEGTDSRFLSSDFSYQHRLSRRTSIGTSLSWSRQTSLPGETGRPVEDRSTDFYNLSGVLNYEFSPTLHLSVSAGPALIQSDQSQPTPATEVKVPAFPVRLEADGFHLVDADTCPRLKQTDEFLIFNADCESIQPALTPAQRAALFSNNPGNQQLVPILGDIPTVDDGNATYFADVTLSKEWQRWTGSLSYTRSEDQSSNFGAVSDMVFGRLRWQLSPHFSNSLLASYNRREQATQSTTSVAVGSNQPLTPDPPFPSGTQGAETNGVRVVALDDDLSVDVMTLSWQLSYRFAERAELYSITSYRNESPSSDAALVLGEVSRFNVMLGVRYAFAPIIF